MNKEKDFISLKWGTLKEWNVRTPAVIALLKEYDASPLIGAMQVNDTTHEKELICKIIDACNADTIYLDWDGKYVSKEEAKSYVLNYGRR